MEDRGEEEKRPTSVGQPARSEICDGLESEVESDVAYINTGKLQVSALHIRSGEGVGREKQQGGDERRRTRRVRPS